MATKQPAPQWRESIDKWLASLRAAGYSEQTLKTRRYQIQALSLGLGGSPLDVTVEDIVEWYADHDWKPETRKSSRNAAVSYFRWLKHSGRRPDDPSEGLPSVKRPQAHPRPCPDRVILAALGRATESERLMIRLGAEAGLRRAEIACVSSDDVMDDLHGKSLIVRGKGDKQRIVPLSDDLAAEILKHRGYLFPGRWEPHCEQSYIGKHVGALLGGGWTTHSLRHRYATMTYQATADIFLVSKLLGHESVETTQRYVALPDSRLRVAVDAVALGA
ncbi:tyrosine-type recombinase/integrase [Bifidobacterium amazonense]|uniref:Tyrosine-type recombinase/integrase n=1 Tax=Bifidobacterium amazonense TaxID=2809027 RepID=A0ABS9VV25_9BIFI|nr:tyrosine-type recombinase/integrase [Bifidobacterium amazonense]MCH9275932.1 tyrosine-type recombinase/integrase [Bifidobacterium amazonense]